MTIKSFTATFVLTASTLSLLAAPALAGEGHGKDHGHGRGNGHARGQEHRYEHLLKRADKNGDGKLQTSELPARMAARFGDADANHDGVLGKEELAAKKASLRAGHLAKIDANHDGKVSPEERSAARQGRIAERFSRMDKNGDGQVGAGEVGPGRWSHLVAADADKSGGVSFAEMQRAITAGKLKHHAK